MIIDLAEAQEKIRHKKIEEKIESYGRILSNIVQNIDDILEDMEESDINWYTASEEQREKIEGISLIGLCIEHYADWVK